VEKCLASIHYWFLFHEVLLITTQLESPLKDLEFPIFIYQLFLRLARYNYNFTLKIAEAPMLAMHWQFPNDDQLKHLLI
jgi:hypothetical protein